MNGYKFNGKGYDNNKNIIYEIKNGKEYKKKFNRIGKLKFEGEYINDKRNGKGKEYGKNGKIQFEGEYLNDKKWKGKGYDIEGNIIYEINKGKGRIKEYDYYNNLIFEGELIYGEKNGKGIEYYYWLTNDSYFSKFEGEYLNGKKNGLGKEYYQNGKVKFEGEYKNGKRNGKGKEYDTHDRLLFEGEYLKGKRKQGKQYDKRGKFKFEAFI